MRKLSKIGVALIAVIASVFGLSATAFAAEPETKTDYGLEAVISSDKEEYKANEDINLSLKVTNTNDFAVENVSLEALIPDGLTIKDKSNLSKSVDSLQSGESIELSVVAVKEGTESSNESSTESSNTSKTDDNKKTVSTGSASNIAILIILVAGAGFAIVLAVKFKKKTTKFIAVILCTAIGFSSVVIFNYPVTAKETDVSSFTVSKVVAVDGKQITISGKVGYSTNSKSPEDNKKPEYDKEHIIKYSNNDYIYKPTEESIAYDSEKFVTYYDNLIIAYTYDDLSSDKADSLADSINGVVVGDISGSVNVLQILVNSTDISTLTSYSNKLMKSDEVMFATYDAPMEISDLTTDSNPWSIDGKTSKDRGNEKNPSGNDWWAEAIGAYTAWEYSDYANPIKVGVLDSGFKLDHEDLSNIKMLEPNFTQNSPEDHGTHVAGIISAQNNNVGIRGVADKAELICADWSPITNDESDPQYVNQLNTGEYIEITKQMIEKGVQVINNSWGSVLQSELTYKTSSWYNLFMGDYKSYCKQYENYIKQKAANCILMMGSLIKNGHEDFIIVQSAGNGYDNTGTHGINAKYSSSYNAINKNLFDTISNGTLYQHITNSNLPFNKLEGIKFEDIDQRILTVGGVENSRDKSGNYYMTKGSNYGENVDICAPSKDILSTVLDYNKNRTTRYYKEESGTSMAAPMVTGAAALVWSINPNYSAGDVKDLLIKSSTYKAIGVGDDKGNSYPMLNVGAAVKTAYEQVKKPYDVTISGTVTDESNTPLSDAKVSLYNNENTLVGSTLTEDGKFSFKLSQKESQNYTLKFEKSGYTSKTEMLLDVKENQTVNVILEKENQSDDTTKRYAAYLQIVKELINKYGEGNCIKKYYGSGGGYDQLKGLCVVRLLDFDGDGKEELLCGYGAADGFVKQSMRIYNFDGKKANIIYNGGIPCSGANPESHIKLIKSNKKIYILTEENPQTFLREVWCEIINGKIIQKVDFNGLKEYNNNYYINGKYTNRIEFFKKLDEFHNSGEFVKIALDNFQREDIKEVLLETNNVLKKLRYSPSIDLNFNVDDYIGKYSSNLLTLTISKEDGYSILICYSNSTGTRVSKNLFLGTIDYNSFSFETRDGFGQNRFTLEFKDGRIYLTGKCVRSDGFWGIPNLNNIELHKQVES